MSLLPSKPDTSAADDAEPRVIGVDSDDADDVISALSSETARKLLAELHDDPAPPSELSERVDTSLQNAQYHLEKLESAGAVSIVDTAYSAKGREMDVYAPADQPLVIFAGDEDRTTGLKAALSRLLGGVGLLGVGSLVVQSLFGGSDRITEAPDGGGGSGGAGGAAGGNGAGGAEAANVTTQHAPQGAATPAPATPTSDPSTYNIQDVNGGEVTRTAAEAVDVTKDSVQTTTTTVLETSTRGANETGHAAAETTTTVAKTTTQAAGHLTDTANHTSDAVASSIPPGLLFFAGGALILALWFVVWYTRE